ncbi:MAG: hypothetical protein PWQ06_130 [Anaerophaga sp.]|nr:hypothetical protein [Anaerophaga sp.]
MEYKDYLEKNLKAAREKYDEAEICHNETGEKRYYTAMKKHENAVRAFEAALGTLNERHQANINSNNLYKRRMYAMYKECKSFAESMPPARAVNLIVSLLAQEVE